MSSAENFTQSAKHSLKYDNLSMLIFIWSGSFEMVPLPEEP